MVVTYPLGGYTVTEYILEYLITYWLKPDRGGNWEAGIVTPQLINGLRQRFVMWY